MVRLAAIETTVRLGGVATCQRLRRLAPQPRPSLRLRACHPTAGRVARPEPSAKGVVVRRRGYLDTVMLGGVGTLPGAASLGTAATPFAEAQSVPPVRGQEGGTP